MSVLSHKSSATGRKTTQYEDTQKKAITNGLRKESTRLGIKSEVTEGAIAGEFARF